MINIKHSSNYLWSRTTTEFFLPLITVVYKGIASVRNYIGGYHYNWTASNWCKPEFRELFTHSFQFGAFCPIMRIHSKGERTLYTKNWDEDTGEILIKFDKLRYRLVSFIYSLAAKTTMNKYTSMRSLVFDFIKDSNVYKIPDQYMFGPVFLVKPVTGKGESERKVYLPGSSLSYNFWTGETLNYGKPFNAAAPINEMPLFVPEGSIVPMGADVEYATQKTNKIIDLRIYPGADCSFTIYEDENDHYKYETGKYATFTLNCNDQQKKLSLSNIKGDFPGRLKQRIFNIVGVNGQQGSGTKVTAIIDRTLDKMETQWC